MPSSALEWARKRGLNCEQDIMAEQLRMQHHARVSRIITNGLLWALLFLEVLRKI